MDVIGTLNAAQGPGAFGFEKLKRVHANLDAPVLDIRRDRGAGRRSRRDVPRRRGPPGR